MASTWCRWPTADRARGRAQELAHKHAGRAFASHRSPAGDPCAGSAAGLGGCLVGVGVAVGLVRQRAGHRHALGHWHRLHRLHGLRHRHRRHPHGTRHAVEHRARRHAGKPGLAGHLSRPAALGLGQWRQRQRDLRRAGTGAQFHLAVAHGQQAQAGFQLPADIEGAGWLAVHRDQRQAAALALARRHHAQQAEAAVGHHHRCGLHRGGRRLAHQTHQAGAGRWRRRSQAGARGHRRAAREQRQAPGHRAG
jgi:hypothetical protein